MKLYHGSDLVPGDLFEVMCFLHDHAYCFCICVSTVDDGTFPGRRVYFIDQFGRLRSRLFENKVSQVRLRFSRIACL